MFRQHLSPAGSPSARVTGRRARRRPRLPVAAAAVIVTAVTALTQGASMTGAMAATRVNAPPVGMAGTPDGNGYWEVASDGGIFSFGDAGFHGSMGGKALNAPMVGMAATPDGAGYWEVAADGGIFAYGDAGFHGSMGGQHLNAPVVGMAATPDGAGYWEVAADGGIFAFGDAGFHGSMGGQPLNAPIVGMAATPDGGGYWEVAADGGIFSFGDAGFHGSMGGQHLNAPMVGMAASDGNGYWEVASDGGLFAFGDAVYHGSVQYTPPTNAALYAKEILANKGITENGRDVTYDLQAAAAGRAGSSGAPLSATLLSLVAELGRYHTVTITALESGGTGHAVGSLHYSGDAVDLGMLDGVKLYGRNTPSITIIKELDLLMPAGSAFGQSNCGKTPPLPPGISTIPDTCNHLHIQVPKGTP